MLWSYSFQTIYEKAVCEFLGPIKGHSEDWCFSLLSGASSLKSFVLGEPDRSNLCLKMVRC